MNTAIKLQQEVQLAIFDICVKHIDGVARDGVAVPFHIGSALASAFFELCRDDNDTYVTEETAQIYEGIIDQIKEGFLEKLNILSDASKTEKISRPRITS